MLSFSLFLNFRHRPFIKLMAAHHLAASTVNMKRTILLIVARRFMASVDLQAGSSRVMLE